MTQFKLVKPLQTRRGKGWSLVYRTGGHSQGWRNDVYVKIQSNYESRAGWRWFLNTPTLMTERRALAHCRANGMSVPEVVCFRYEGGVAKLVLDAIDGVHFDEFLRDCEREETAAEAVRQAAQQIGRLHSLNWTHGALGNDHILVGGDGSVTLIDFEKARWNPFGKRRELDRFWRRTNCLGEAQADLFRREYESSLKGA